jgi:hypothetical protein
MPPEKGVRRKLADNCVAFPWAADRRSFLCSFQNTLALFDATSGQRRTILEGSTSAARLSWDSRWVTFYEGSDEGYPRIFVAPILPDRASARADLIPITDGLTWDALPEFSPDGRILYFQSERDGSRCLWAQRLDADTKKPVGKAFPVQHFHQAALTLLHVKPGQRAIAVARDKIVITVAERTGNIWLASFEE